jgi:hypothetical protein
MTKAPPEIDGAFAERCYFSASSAGASSAGLLDGSLLRGRLLDGASSAASVSTTSASSTGVSSTGAAFAFAFGVSARAADFVDDAAS